MVSKVYEKPDEFTSIDNLKLTRTNSVLTVFPEMYRDDQVNRNRMLSTRNLPNQFFSPEARKPQNQYLISPRNNENQYHLSPRMNEHQFANSPRMN
jgi:hypothetical protein